MTVDELFDIIGDEDSFMTMIDKSVDISIIHMKETKEAVEKVQKAIEEKYCDDEATVSESDINDLEIAAQAFLNSLCMYLGAMAIYCEGDFEKNDHILNTLNEILNT